MAAAAQVDAYGNPIQQQQPLQDPNSTQPVQLTNQAMTGAAASQEQSTPQSVQQGNLNLIGQAQTSASQQTGQPTQLQQATTNQALNYVQNPMGSYNPAAVKQAALDKGSSDWGNAFEATRQQYGNVSGSGLTQQNMLNNVLQHNLSQEELGAQMDQQNYQVYADAMSKSLAGANAVTGENANVYAQYLNNLGNVNAMSEKAISDQLAQKGFDYQVIQNAYNNGTATLQDVQNFLSKAGIQTSANAQQANQQQANQNLQYQFGLTHPQYVNPNGTLNAQGIAAYNNAQNATTGEPTTLTGKVADILTSPNDYIGMANPNNPNNALYQQMMSSSPTFTGDPNTLPSQGQSFLYNGQLYVAKTSPKGGTTSNGAPLLYVQALDPNTGNVTTISTKQLAPNPT
jgi:hypothetical protein